MGRRRQIPDTVSASVVELYLVANVLKFKAQVALFSITDAKLI
jgi:hypothetical protein